MFICTLYADSTLYVYGIIVYNINEVVMYVLCNNSYLINWLTTLNEKNLRDSRQPIFFQTQTTFRRNIFREINPLKLHDFPTSIAHFYP